MKLLVAIASYGSKNDVYLQRLLDEYRRMTHDVKVVVLCNIKKPVGTGVELVVGLPTTDPWSLPFGHKQLFADRLHEYDLFIYSEDDTLITQKNIDAFLAVTPKLSPNEVAGFIRSEQDEKGQIYISTIHSHFHWVPGSVRRTGEYAFAYLTNEHAACYILTRDQLRRAIESGGYLVPPHEGRYDLLCSAATDPYTRCGLRKLICISHVEAFTVPHLPNRYIGTMGLSRKHLQVQIDKLLELSTGTSLTYESMVAETALPNGRWSKSYYEPCQLDAVSLIPPACKNVLSVGCGWGSTERYLATKGIDVVAIPLDPVIGACASAEGVKILFGNLESAVHLLDGQTFDGILISNILHLIRSPIPLIQSLMKLLANRGSIIASVPNFERRPASWRHLRNVHDPAPWGYDARGSHATNYRMICEWFREARLTVDELVAILPPRYKFAKGLPYWVSGLLAETFVVRGRRV